MDTKIIIRDETDADAEAVSEVTVAAFKAEGETAAMAERVPAPRR